MRMPNIGAITSRSEVLRHDTNVKPQSRLKFKRLKRRPSRLKSCEALICVLDAWPDPLFSEILFTIELVNKPGFSYTPLSRFETTSAIVTPSASHARNSVVTVIGRPASNCCQCFPEKPNRIISSCEKERWTLNSTHPVP